MQFTNGRCNVPAYRDILYNDVPPTLFVSHKGVKVRWVFCTEGTVSSEHI